MTVATRIITVADHERSCAGPFDFGDYEEGSLDRVIASLLAIRDSIPESSRATARCQIDAVAEYDGYVPRIEVAYSSPRP